MNGDCIFCKIVARQVPAYVVYESNHCIAFLDINPVSYGHCLVVPKQHIETFADATPEIICELFKCVQQVAVAVCKATSAAGFNVVINSGEVAGQVIKHLHVHIVPRYTNDGLTIDKQPSTKLDEAEANQLIEKLQQMLKQT